MKSIFLLVLFSLSSCGGGTTTGNPVHTVNLKMQDRAPLAFLKKISDAILPSAYANISGISFCFKRLRFKPDESTNGTNYDLELGRVEIDAVNGTDLLTIVVPEGTYRRIEFDLEGGCDGDALKPSVTFLNGSTSYSTQDNMTIKFEGTYRVTSNGTLNLDIDALVDTMNTISDSNQIKSELENSTGQF